MYFFLRPFGTAIVAASAEFYSVLPNKGVASSSAKKHVFTLVVRTVVFPKMIHVHGTTTSQERIVNHRFMSGRTCQKMVSEALT